MLKPASNAMHIAGGNACPDAQCGMRNCRCHPAKAAERMLSCNASGSCSKAALPRPAASTPSWTGLAGDPAVLSAMRRLVWPMHQHGWRTPPSSGNGKYTCRRQWPCRSLRHVPSPIASPATAAVQSPLRPPRRRGSQTNPCRSLVLRSAQWSLLCRPRRPLQARLLCMCSFLTRSCYSTIDVCI